MCGVFQPPCPSQRSSDDRFSNYHGGGVVEGMQQSQPLGPLSRLPQLPLSDDPETRFVAPAAAGRKQAPAVTQQQQALRKRAEDGAQAMEAAGQVSLYSFNINELYDYDLPNIRRPSDALTAMASQKLNSGSRKGSSRVLPPLSAPEGYAGDAADEQRDPAAEEEEGEEEGEGKLKTGDEAANFFARNGNHTPVKFVYLNRARTGDAFRPYDLSVVSREQVDAEYFTMSACGVVHVFASGLPSEFVLLSTWMQQSTFFNVPSPPAPPPHPGAPPSPLPPPAPSPATPPPPLLLPRRPTPKHPRAAACCWPPPASACGPAHRFAPLQVLTSIRFFKHYLAAKIFRLWRANVRYKLYCAQRNKLTGRLFLAKPAFCGTLLEINALCYELRTGDNTRLMAAVGQNYMSVDTFLEEQSTQRAHAAKAFEQIIDKLQALVEKVCKDVTTRARLSDDTLGAGQPGEGGDGPEKAHKPAKSKSMAQAKEEQAARLAAVRRAVAEAAMLGDLIRLADYMAVSCCYLLVIQAPPPTTAATTTTTTARHTPQATRHTPHATRHTPHATRARARRAATPHRAAPRRATLHHACSTPRRPPRDRRRSGCSSCCTRRARMDCGSQPSSSAPNP